MPYVPHAVVELHPRLTFETKASQIHSRQQGVNGKARQVLPSPTLWKVHVFLLAPHLLLGSRSALLPLLAVPHAPGPVPNSSLWPCSRRRRSRTRCTTLAVSSALLPSMFISCSRSLWICCCRNPFGSLTGGLMMFIKSCGGKRKKCQARSCLRRGWQVQERSGVVKSQFRARGQSLGGMSA